MFWKYYTVNLNDELFKSREQMGRSLLKNIVLTAHKRINIPKATGL